MAWTWRAGSVRVVSSWMVCHGRVDAGNVDVTDREKTDAQIGHATSQRELGGTLARSPGGYLSHCDTGKWSCIIVSLRT